MAGNLTLTMVKPRAVRDGHTGSILSMIQAAGFRIVAMKSLRLTADQAEAFYAVHRERSFYHDLVRSISSGPIVAAILMKENAVESFRELIGATDPSKAAPGTIRHKYGTSIEANAVHGSDSDDNAIIECNFFFSQLERLL
jgi:nucleoside-diphosphate kinase